MADSDPSPFSQQQTVPPTAIRTDSATPVVLTNSPSPGIRTNSATAGEPIPAALAASTAYEVIRELNRGGMGVVYLVRNRRMDRLEGLKVIQESLLRQAGAQERFERELRLAARLNHPNIVTAYSAPELAGLLAFAMEYVDGMDLARLVKRDGPLPVGNACSYVHQAALGLQHAHEEGLVHRDIKPGNLMLKLAAGRQVIKILDFGLAKATSEHPVAGGLTGTGQTMGTPHYMSPEQSADTSKADIRADIYSLGCTLYHLLGGHPPFDTCKSLYSILRAQEHEIARPLCELRSDVPNELAAIVAKMMEKSPADRYQTPADVASALAPFFLNGIDPIRPFDAELHSPAAAISDSVKSNETENKGQIATTPNTPVLATVPLVRPESTPEAALANTAIPGTTVVPPSRPTAAKPDSQNTVVPGNQNARRHVPRVLKIGAAILMVIAASLAVWKIRVPSDSSAPDAPSAVNSVAGAAGTGSTAPHETKPGDESSIERVALLSDPLGMLLPGFTNERSFPAGRGGPERAGPEKTDPGDDMANEAADATPCILPLDRIASKERLPGLWRDAEIEFRFDEHWSDAQQFAVYFGSAPESALMFSLASVSPSDVPDAKTLPPMRDRNSREKPLVMELRMTQASQVPLLVAQRQVTVSGGPIHLKASKRGNAVNFVINDSQRLDFRLLRPLPEASVPYLAFDWPAAVKLLDFQIFAFPRATPESPLTKADALLANDEFEQAAATYARVAADTANADARREAQLKEAWCYDRLNRIDDVRDICMRLLSDREKGGNGWWRAAAAGRIAHAIARDVSLHPDEYSMAQVRQLLADRLAEFRIEQLQAVVPLEEQREVFDIIRDAWGFDESYSMLDPIPDRLARLRELMALAPGTAADARLKLLLNWRLVDAMHLESDVHPEEITLGVPGREAGVVVEQALELMRNGKIRPAETVSIIRDYVWLQIRLHQEAAALARLDDLHKKQFANIPTGQALLRIEQARLEAARDNWDAARKHLDQFFQALKTGVVQRAELAYCEFAEACLLRGWAGQYLGEPQTEVQDRWAQGCYRHAGDFAPMSVPFGEKSLGKEMRDKDRALFTAACLGALTQDISDEECSSLLDLMLTSVAEGGPLFERIREYLNRWFPPEYVRRTVLALYASDDRLVLARDRVLGRNSFFDHFALPTAHMARVGVLVELGPHDYDQGLDRRIFKIIYGLFRLHVTGQLGADAQEGQNFVSDVLSAWYGKLEHTGLEGMGKARPPQGWEGAREFIERLRANSVLDNDVPASFAYVIGCRILNHAPTAKPNESKRWNYANAAELLKYAIENSPPESAIKSLAAERYRIATEAAGR